jgi:hypothetical protein
MTSSPGKRHRHGRWRWLNSISDHTGISLARTRLWRRPGLTGSFGVRLEGVPALDVIGGDQGFRRPGYVVSLEPGLAIATRHHTISLSVPVAVRRDRIRSYADRLNGGHGDAAFADFLIALSYSYTLPSRAGL